MLKTLVDAFREAEPKANEKGGRQNPGVPSQERQWEFYYHILAIPALYKEELRKELGEQQKS